MTEAMLVCVVCLLLLLLVGGGVGVGGVVGWMDGWYVYYPQPFQSTPTKNRKTRNTTKKKRARTGGRCACGK